MGEEKPDEELMGKRKSSPRLSTTSCDADNFILSVLRMFIPSRQEKGWKMAKRLRTSCIIQSKN